MKRCIICNEPLRPANGVSVRPRRDKLCCGATCRKRLQRRRAQGHMVMIDLPGQQLLPLERDGHTNQQGAPNRQPQNRPGSTTDGPCDV